MHAMPKTWKKLLKNIQSRNSTVKTSLTAGPLCFIRNMSNKEIKMNILMVFFKNLSCTFNIEPNWHFGSLNKMLVFIVMILLSEPDV